MTQQIRKDIEDLFYTLSICAILLGGVGWITTLSFQTDANAKDVQQIKSKMDATSAQFEEIRTRLTHIEDAVENK